MTAPMAMYISPQHHQHLHFPSTTPRTFMPPMSLLAFHPMKLVSCMEEAPHPSDEQIYKTFSDLYNAIPDTSIVTLRELREQVSTRLDMDRNGLDDKKGLCKQFMDSLVNDLPPPDFDDTGACVPEALVDPIPMSFQRAMTASAGFILRKLAKPRFVPLVPPNVDICDLHTKEFSGRNPLKHLVDVILNYKCNELQENEVKNSVIHGDLTDLPYVAKPPPQAPPVNHFTQTAFIAVAPGTWNIVKHIVFQSDGADGKVHPEIARQYAHGTPLMVNFGKNIQCGKRAFHYLFQDMGDPSS
jgi:hypothetical protein